jgi:5-methyltetrahydrofolate--homocysteine methyltransferase
MIGLSGLITPSLDEMVTGRGRDAARGAEHAAPDRRRDHQQGPHGAPHRRAYEGPVLHVLDASRAVGSRLSLVSDTQRDPLVAKTAAEYEQVRVTRANKGQNDLSTLAEARANGFAYDPRGKPPRAASPGLHSFGEWPLRDFARRSTGPLLPRLGAGRQLSRRSSPTGVGESAPACSATRRRCSTG